MRAEQITLSLPRPLLAEKTMADVDLHLQRWATTREKRLDSRGACLAAVRSSRSSMTSPGRLFGQLGLTSERMDMQQRRYERQMAYQGE